MRRATEVWDDSAAESFSTLKAEPTARKVRCRFELDRLEMFDELERFCDPTRRHSRLGNGSPMLFRTSSRSLGVHWTGNSPRGCL